MFADSSAKWKKKNEFHTTQVKKFWDERSEKTTKKKWNYFDECCLLSVFLILDNRKQNDDFWSLFGEPERS